MSVNRNVTVPLGSSGWRGIVSTASTHLLEGFVDFLVRLISRPPADTLRHPYINAEDVLWVRPGQTVVIPWQ